MRRLFSFIAIAALMVSLSIPSAHATDPPLVFLSTNKGDFERGQVVELFISVYSTATEPTTATLTLLLATGLTLVDAPRWSSQYVWYDHPISILAKELITDSAPTNGTYIPITTIITDAEGHQVSASTSIRVGTFPWPPAQCDFCHWQYLPLIHT